MKRQTILIVLLLLGSLLCWGQTDFDIEDVPETVQADYNAYILALNEDDLPGQIEALESLLAHNRDVPIDASIDELMRYSGWTNTKECQELHLATRLCLASLYLTTDDTVRYLDLLPSLYGSEDGYMISLIPRSTLLCDFMCAVGGWCSSWDYLFKTLYGKIGYDERLDIIESFIKSGAVMLRCLKQQPYDTRQTSLTFAASRYSAVNSLLLVAMYRLNLPVNAEAISTLNCNPGLEKIVNVWIQATAQEIPKVVREMLTTFATKSPHVLQYVVDEIVAGGSSLKTYTDRENKEWARFSLLTLLSESGYAPATFQLGLYTELNRFKNLYPHRDKRREEPDLREMMRYYQLAANQGSDAAKIRLAHCYTFGIGCGRNPAKALSILEQYTDHVDFPRLGAYAYATLLEQNVKRNPVIIKNFLSVACMAARQGMTEKEIEGGKLLIETYYDIYY